MKDELAKICNHLTRRRGENHHSGGLTFESDELHTKPKNKDFREWSDECRKKVEHSYKCKLTRKPCVATKYYWNPTSVSKYGHWEAIIETYFQLRCPSFE